MRLGLEQQRFPTRRWEISKQIPLPCPHLRGMVCYFQLWRQVRNEKYLTRGNSLTIRPSIRPPPFPFGSFLSACFNVRQSSKTRGLLAYVPHCLWNGLTPNLRQSEMI